MGSVPDWLGAGAGTAALLHQIISRSRREAAASWPELLRQMSNLSDRQLERTLEDHPRVIDLVARAWEEASKTHLEEKQELLARVAARAIDSPGDEQVEELSFFLSTVATLEPPHVKLLVWVATPSPGMGPYVGTRFEGYATAGMLAERWPAAKLYLHPMLATLAGAGLIENKAQGSYIGITDVVWGLTDYGKQFLHSLLEDRLQDQNTAALVLRIDGEDTLVVRNLGPAAATIMSVEPVPSSQDAPVLSCEALAYTPVELADERSSSISPARFQPGVIYAYPLKWTDGAGLHKTKFELQLL